MNKKSLLAVLLVLAMLLSGCSLVTMDPEVDASTPIVTLGDTVYTKAQINAYVDNYLAQLAAQYAQQYNYNIDITDAEVIASAQDEVIHELIERDVMDAKAIELGVSELTDEEKAELEEQYNDFHDLFAGWLPEDMDEELKEAYIAQYMYMYTGVTDLEDMTRTKVMSKLRDEVVKDVAVTEEEVQAAYDEAVADDRINFASSPNTYGVNVNNGTTVYYRPAGYRMVKNLLIEMDDADQDCISTLRSRASSQQSTANSLLTSLNGYENVDVDALTAQVSVEVGVPAVEPTEDETSAEAATDEAPEAETALVVPDLIATATDMFEVTEDETQQEINRLAREYATALALSERYTALADEAVDAAFAKLDARADEALAKLDAGEAFDAVMAEYTDDPGMQGDSDAAKNGYAVRAGFTSFDTAFVDAAMGLTHIGEYSAKTRGMYGYYIVQYVNEVTEGAVALEDVRDAASEIALSEKQDAVYHETVEKWEDECGAVIDKKPLSY